MAIFSPNNDEYYDNTNDILDEMEDACVNMLNSLGMLNETGGGARGKYVEMQAKKSADYEKKAQAMPDTVTKTVSKGIGPIKISRSREVPNKEKQDMMHKHYEAEKQAAKYAGTYEDYGKKGKEEIDDDGKKRTVRERWSSTQGSINNIYNAGKPRLRLDSGSHRSSMAPNYEAIAASKAAKEKFKKDFGGPDKPDYLGGKYPTNHAYYRNWAQDYNKKKIIDHLKSTGRLDKDGHPIKKESYYDDSYSQADFIREACYTILATLDELE